MDETSARRPVTRNPFALVGNSPPWDPRGQTYIGAYVGTAPEGTETDDPVEWRMADLRNFQGAVLKRPVLMGTFVNWGPSSPSSIQMQLDAIIEGDPILGDDQQSPYIPIIEMYMPQRIEQVRELLTSTEANQLIRSIANEFKAFAQRTTRPIFFDPFYEITSHRVWTDNPADVIDAWRHLHNQFTNVHKVPNLVWVWHGDPQQAPVPAGQDQFKGIYPGDDVCDWIGLSVYKTILDPANGPEARFVIQAAQHGKPVIIVESTRERPLLPLREDGCFRPLPPGPLPPGSCKRPERLLARPHQPQGPPLGGVLEAGADFDKEWHQLMFQFIRGHNIAAWQLFNINWCRGDMSCFYPLGDARINGTPVGDLLRTEFRDPRYLSSGEITERPTFTLTVSPPDQTVEAGEQATYTVTVRADRDDFDAPVILESVANSAFITGSFDQSALTPRQAQASTTLRIMAMTGASGPFDIWIRAEKEVLNFVTRIAKVSLHVQAAAETPTPDDTEVVADNE